jgi:hypothetical protein
MAIRPVAYTKEHPLAVATCILIGMGLSHYGFGLSSLPFISARGKVSAGGDGE